MSNEWVLRADCEMGYRELGLANTSHWKKEAVRNSSCIARNAGLLVTELACTPAPYRPAMPGM